jgi:hypothetical protein
MTPGFQGLLGHMVSKRFSCAGYYLTRSSLGFRLAIAYNLGSQSSASSTEDSVKASALRAEIKSLQDKGAIVPIDNPGPGFYSHIFVASTDTLMVCSPGDTTSTEVGLGPKIDLTNIFFPEE